MLNKKTRNIILVIFLFLITIGSIIYYFNYNIKIVRQDYESKISNLNNEIISNLKSLQEALQAQIEILGSNLSSQIGFVVTDVTNFKKQNQKELKTLTQLIDQIEQQSNIKLNELKDELKNIKIKSADFSAIVNDVLQSVVSVKTNLGQGSGVIIDTKGYVVTNVHVISGASTVRVVTYAGNTYDVNVLVGYDSVADIAVLKIDAPNLGALRFGDCVTRMGECHE